MKGGGEKGICRGEKGRNQGVVLHFYISFNLLQNSLLLLILLCLSTQFRAC